MTIDNTKPLNFPAGQDPDKTPEENLRDVIRNIIVHAIREHDHTSKIMGGSKLLTDAAFDNGYTARPDTDAELILTESVNSIFNLLYREYIAG